MVRPHALVLRGDGINCELETLHALELAGFSGETLSALELSENPSRLTRSCQFLVLPGGFSFGDEVRSGKILAVKLRARVKEALINFSESGHLILGICNGFQALVQLGILPDGKVLDSDEERPVTLAHNSGGRFIDRWVDMTVSPQSRTEGYFANLEVISLPVRHGEGRLVLKEGDGQLPEKIKALGALRYNEDLNGSFDRIAALTSPGGNVLGLMPHPECFVRRTQHPNWTARGENLTAQGLKIFENAHKMLLVSAEK
jgi:Phosphoribosylformylglycinamidine (FGAM) synthase, glutamine amidotransferase domain